MGLALRLVPVVPHCTTAPWHIDDGGCWHGHLDDHFMVQGGMGMCSCGCRRPRQSFGTHLKKGRKKQRRKEQNVAGYPPMQVCTPTQQGGELGTKEVSCRVGPGSLIIEPAAQNEGCRWMHSAWPEEEEEGKATMQKSRWASKAVAGSSPPNGCAEEGRGPSHSVVVCVLVCPPNPMVPPPNVV